MKCYVGNLSFETTELELRAHFEQQGEVREVTIITDRETGKPRGFGFVEMVNDDAGHEAIRQLDGKELGGRPLKVNVAKPRERS